MKYVSIDIETTGLNPTTDDVIEFGAVIDDLSNPKPIDELPRFHCYIIKEAYTGSPYALSMHPIIFKRIATKEVGYEYLKPEELGRYFNLWLQKNGFNHKEGKVSINVAGKNAAMFDLPFLKSTSFHQYIVVRHRVIDPAILYYIPGDEKLPDSKLCMTRAGITGEVAHTAVEDAVVVIQLLRKKLLP